MKTKIPRPECPRPQLVRGAGQGMGAIETEMLQKTARRHSRLERKF